MPKSRALPSTNSPPVSCKNTAPSMRQDFDHLVSQLRAIPSSIAENTGTMDNVAREIA